MSRREHKMVKSQSDVTLAFYHGKFYPEETLVLPLIINAKASVPVPRFHLIHMGCRLD